jgi:hypothetical protein
LPKVMARVAPAMRAAGATIDANWAGSLKSGAKHRRQSAANATRAGLTLGFHVVMGLGYGAQVV